MCVLLGLVSIYYLHLADISCTTGRPCKPTAHVELRVGILAGISQSSATELFNQILEHCLHVRHASVKVFSRLLTQRSNVKSRKVSILENNCFILFIVDHFLRRAVKEPLIFMKSFL